MAYICSNDIYYPQSARIHMVLQHKDILITSTDDWHKLELMTLFMLSHTKCSATNYLGDTIVLPRPNERLEQDTIGELPCLLNNPKCLIALAPGHPIIDCVLVSDSNKHVYLIQTSFLRYPQHKKKDDLFLAPIKGESIYSYSQLHFPVTSSSMCIPLLNLNTKGGG